MTNAQIITKAKREIKKMVSPNEILSIKFTGVDFAKVEMPSTCEAGATMFFEFFISYTEGNENVFTELEKKEFPNMIVKDSLTVTFI